MLIKRESNDRGAADHGWLKAKHTFSFGDYFDAQYMGFRNLRVINEDRVAAGAGFPTHPHRDMEIITYVLAGGVAHKDSTGGEGVIRPGDVQVMSAGSGVRHSEFNASDNDELHLLQIWIQPHTQGVAPRYDQRHFNPTARQNALQLVVSGDTADGVLFVNADAKLYAGLLQTGKSLTHALNPDRFGWLQLARGTIDVNGIPLAAGDGLAFGDESTLAITATADAEFLLFDLP
jgi:redox-sensitive bicupin YhaK (pirin superfamily)